MQAPPLAIEIRQLHLRDRGRGTGAADRVTAPPEHVDARPHDVGNARRVHGHVHAVGCEPSCALQSVSVRRDARPPRAGAPRRTPPVRRPAPRPAPCRRGPRPAARPPSRPLPRRRSPARSRRAGRRRPPAACAAPPARCAPRPRRRRGHAVGSREGGPGGHDDEVGRAPVAVQAEHGLGAAVGLAAGLAPRAQSRRRCWASRRPARRRAPAQRRRPRPGSSRRGRRPRYEAG